MISRVRRLATCGNAVATCGTIWDDHPGPKEEMLQSSKLGGSNIGLAGLAGLARLARLARLAGVAGRRIGTTKSNTLDAQERSADILSRRRGAFVANPKITQTNGD